MRADAIGNPLDEAWSVAAPGPRGRPFGDRVDGEVVIAIGANGRDPEADTAVSESRGGAARHVLISRDSPLIVHDVQNHRRLIDGREQQRRMKVRLSGCSLANPP